jgi:diaminohydroxyphosphoribosylaminopyrimidine deaminase/5-amino-6-(5-phosphoribosylamino)uracil reductase
MPFTEHDAAALRRAASLAERGRGEVEPNPRVGAVLHRDGTVLAEGYHRAWGAEHAEVEALGRAAAPFAGATLVTTLEPCTSAGGAKKQPPCAEAIVRAGVRRVVIGEIDPDPRHRGAGMRRLSAAGVEVVTAPVGSVPDRLLRDFRTHLGRARPWVILKWAQTADGRWSTPDRRHVSGEPARAEVHRLRRSVDAILVGSGTVLADDPLLTARPAGSRPLQRIVVDARGRVPPDARLFRTADQGPVLWVVGPRAPAASPAGVERIALRFPHDAAMDLPQQLRSRGIERILVEGGPSLALGWLRCRAVDRGWVFVSRSSSGGGRCPRLRLDRATFERERIEIPTVESVESCGGDAWFKLRWS